MKYLIIINKNKKGGRKWEEKSERIIILNKES